MTDATDPSLISLPTPAELGAPAQYTQWRGGQDQAFAAMINCDKYAVGINAPVGLGKSLIAVSWHLLSGLNACILTRNKALMKQYQELFASIGLKSVKGMSNYDCDGMTPDHHRMWKMTSRSDRAPSCEEGPCHDGFRCDLRVSGCRYYDAIRLAGGFTVTNYDFWLANQNYGQDKIGPYDLLIMDESHEASSALSDFMSDEVLTWEVETLLGSRWPKIPDTQVDDWLEWSKLMAKRIEHKLQPSDEGGARGRERRMYRALDKKMATVAHVADKESRWVITPTDRGKKFQPVWPMAYRKMLFQDVKQVAFMSASIRPKELQLCGLTPDEYNFHDFPSSFPVERRLITRIPTCQVKASTPLSAMEGWRDRIDQIIRAGRVERKGIIHTVSYKLANFVYEGSRYRDLMFVHDSKTREATVEAFKKADRGILVSPSVGQGYDFPGRACEWQIIGKLAFPDTRDPIMEARCAEDEEYRAYLVMTALVQAVGRGMRGPEDACENFIIDDQAQWFLRKWAYLAPYWFAEAYREVETVPMASLIRPAA